jgi:F0F1-type ATP synthase assembly protein I
MVVKKALKKADKMLAENKVKDVKDLNDVQKAQQMNRNVTIGLILILVGVVAGIFIWPIGAIVGTIGVVFLILGLLDY